MKKSSVFLVMSIFLFQVSHAFSQDTSKVKGGYTSCVISSGYYGYDKEKIYYDAQGKLLEDDQYRDDSGIPLLRKKIRQNFDKKGNMLEYAVYSSYSGYEPCHLDNKEQWKYDDKGNLVESCKYYSSDTSLAYKFKYKYDEKGNQVELDYYAAIGDEPGDKIISKYDENRKIIEKSEYNPPSSLQKKEIWKNDTIGREIEYSQYDDKDILISIDKSSYDANGNKTEKVNYNAGGIAVKKATWKYYDNGKKKEYAYSEIFNSGSLEMVLEKWTYDTNGDVIKSVKYDKDGVEQGSTEYKYDEYGNIIEEAVYYKASQLSSDKKYIYFK